MCTLKFIYINNYVCKLTINYKRRHVQLIGSRTIRWHMIIAKISTSTVNKMYKDFIEMANPYKWTVFQLQVTHIQTVWFSIYLSNSHQIKSVDNSSIDLLHTQFKTTHKTGESVCRARYRFVIVPCGKIHVTVHNLWVNARVDTSI